MEHEPLTYWGRPIVWRGELPTLTWDRRWEEAALCEWVCRHWGWSSNVWHPPSGRVSHKAPRIAAEAIRVCNQCTVRTECAAYAAEFDDPAVQTGIWGGVWLDQKPHRNA